MTANWTRQEQKEPFSILFPCSPCTYASVLQHLFLNIKRCILFRLFAFVLVFTVKTRPSCSRFLAIHLIRLFKSILKQKLGIYDESSFRA